MSNATTMALRMYKLDPIILAHRVKNNRETHEYYLKHTMEQAAILRDIVEQGVKPSTSASGSKPLGNTKNERILLTPSSNEKNKVEVQSKKVKSKLNKQNSNSKNVCKEHVKHPVKGALALCSVCNECLFDANHAMCLIDHVNSMNMHDKSASKKNKKKKEWKPTGKVITAANKVPLRVPIPLEVVAPKYVVTRVYTRRPKVPKSVPNNKLKYLDSSCSKHMIGDRSQLTNFVHKFLGTVKFGNDQVAKIMGYGDYHIGNVTISRVYYVEGLGHNLFSVGSRGTNLYSLSTGDMMASSPICLLSKATKTKSWLWHRRLAHLNFSALNHLARNGLVRDTNQEKLYLLHMDLCGPMRVASINGKKYILIIVDDYSRFTWVKFLSSKNEAPNFIIKFLKMIQVRLNAVVRNIRTDNGAEFVNQTMRDYYEQVGISHETLVARTLQQNGVVEWRNRTLVEAARTMLIYAKAPLFLWAKAVANACYTQNRSII
ncbi:retrovirus-related pol polyprotein from transposon TNT 1-94 [Tanacetum coccineum]